jgi:hypothetical protein
MLLYLRRKKHADVRSCRAANAVGCWHYRDCAKVINVFVAKNRQDFYNKGRLFIAGRLAGLF